MGIKLRTLYRRGKHVTNEIHPQLKKSFLKGQLTEVQLVGKEVLVDAAFIVVMSEEEGGVNTALWQSACLALARPCVSSPNTTKETNKTPKK